MPGCGCLRTEGENRPSRPGHVVVADNVRCLNPWDCQSKRQYRADGVYRTLDAGNCAGGQAHGVCYALDSTFSNSMKSSNPRSGFHEETVTKTLNTSSDPTCAQGGNVIVQVSAFMGGQGAKARSIAYCDDGRTPTLKSAPSGGNTVPDVVYPINTMVATRGGADDGRTTFGVGDPSDPQFTITAAHMHDVCYAVEGNSVDRDSKKNGKGYCEDVSPTLNTQDKHTVAYAIEGNGARPSHQGTGVSDSGKCFTLNATEHHAVAYGIDQQGGKGVAGYGENVSPALCSDSHGTPHAVCFQQNQREEVRDMGEQTGALAAEPGTHQQNYVCFGVDCRNAALDEEMTHTIQAKSGVGFSANCTPSVLYRAAQYGQYKEGVGTLKASGGDAGGRRNHCC